jgi:hypothetical protein
MLDRWLGVLSDVVPFHTKEHHMNAKSGSTSVDSKAKTPYVSPTVTALGAAATKTLGDTSGIMTEAFSENISWT